MPNHCRNMLTVTGNAADLKEFQAMAQGKGPAWDGKEGEKTIDLDLHAFVPIPKEVLNASVVKYGRKQNAFNSGGYEWCIKNWGTKWGAYDIEVNKKSGELVYWFATAWAPPSNDVIDAMSAKFPKLRFMLKYAEMGCSFAGIYRVGWMWDTEDTEYKSKPRKDADLSFLWESSG